MREVEYAKDVKNIPDKTKVIVGFIKGLKHLIITNSKSCTCYRDRSQNKTRTARSGWCLVPR
jgi:hypothetical protein